MGTPPSTGAGGGNGGAGGGSGGGGEKTPATLSTKQFILALVLIGTIVFVAWYLIQQELIDKSDSSIFYSNVVEGLIILGAAFFGIPLSWRAGKASGEAEGKAEGEQNKQNALTEQKKQIGNDGKRLTEQAMSAHGDVHDTIQENFATRVGSRTYLIARDELGDRTVQIDMDPLDHTREALARLDQYMSDLQSG